MPWAVLHLLLYEKLLQLRMFLFNCCCSWSLPPRGGEGWLPADGHPEHKQPLSARQPGDVCSKADQSAARGSLCLFLRQLGLWGQRPCSASGANILKTEWHCHSRPVRCIFNQPCITKILLISLWDEETQLSNSLVCPGHTTLAEQVNASKYFHSAYHGHLSTLIDISPYKFDLPGGDGKQDWVHVVSHIMW